MKHDICGAAFLIAALAFTSATTADIIFESGTLGPTAIAIDEIVGDPDPGGAVVSPQVFNGVRFNISQPALVTAIGGHFVNDPQSDDSFFGAIVRLDDASDFPDSEDLSSPDVLGHTLLTFPDPSDEAFGDLDLVLEPGWHGLVFGSGLFGATGSGGAILNNPDIGDPSYIAFQPGPGFGWGNLSSRFANFRLVVEGSVIPETSTAALLGILSFVSLFVRGIRVQ